MNKKEPGSVTPLKTREPSQNSLSFVSLEQVLRAHPDTFRAALQSISPERQPMRWAAEQLKLGASLRHQSRRENGLQRIQILRQIVEAFEQALFIYCRCTRMPEEPLIPKAAPRSMSSVDDVQTLDDVQTPADAVEVILEVSRRSVLHGADDLEEAISVLSHNTSDSVRRENYAAWAMNMINLGCTLTLAGKCDSGSGDISRLEEAVDTFHAILGDPQMNELPFEKALANINLAEAFCSIGEVSSHEQHIAFLDSAVEALARALMLVAPDEVQRLVRADPRTFV